MPSLITSVIAIHSVFVVDSATEYCMAVDDLETLGDGVLTLGETVILIDITFYSLNNTWIDISPEKRHRSSASR